MRLVLTIGGGSLANTPGTARFEDGDAVGSKELGDSCLSNATCAVMVLCEAPALCTPRTISIWLSINYVVPIVDMILEELGGIYVTRAA